ncbi:hypothetical protein [Oryzobacter telluris]|uniref:hypothetical protein n=1 Tax=Oryzobacter telluris TaxID=3149179 RepID=UPI00370DAB4C
MWRLKNSRGLFLNSNNMAQDRSIWSYVAAELAGAATTQEARNAIDEYTARPEWRLLSDFAPNRSNCPIVERNAVSLHGKLPSRWSALADNIFYGVTLDGLPNAEAHNQRFAAIVSVSLQFIWMIESYVLAYDAMLYSFREHARAYERGDVPTYHQEELVNSREAWRRLERAAEGWRDEFKIDPGDQSIHLYVPGREAADIDEAVQSVVTFTLGHELAHHILGHTSKNSERRAKEARAMLLCELSETSRAFIESYPANQQKELLCDAMAFKIVAGSFSDGTTGERDYKSAYNAIIGGCFSLLALAHVGEHWIEQRSGETHPSFQVRWQSLLLIAFETWEGWQRDRSGGHPLDLTHQLRMFVDSAFTNWLGMRGWPAAEGNAEVSDAEFQDALYRLYVQTWDERIGRKYPPEGLYEWPRPPEFLANARANDPSNK